MTGIKLFIAGWKSSWLLSMTVFIGYVQPIAVPWVIFGALFGGALGGLLGAKKKGITDRADVLNYSASLALIGVSIAMLWMRRYPDDHLAGYVVIPIAIGNGLIGLNLFETFGRKLVELVEQTDFADFASRIIGTWQESKKPKAEKDPED